MDRQAAKYRAKVTILVADGNYHLCQGIRNALADEGYQDIRSVSRLSAVREIMASAMIDLLVLDVDLPDGDGIALVRDIRHGKIGRNPFLPVIFVTWESNPEIVRRAVSSGVDLILVKPMSAAQLFSRIDQLVVDRKPFVATADYVGPDRRSQQAPDEGQFYKVPNTLKDKIEGKKVNQAELSGQIESAMQVLSSRRLEEAAIQLGANIDVICRSFEPDAPTDDLEYALSQSSFAAREIANLGSIEIVKLCATLMEIVGTIRIDPSDVDGKQIDLLRMLAQSIMLACKSGHAPRAVMDEISQMLSEARPKQRPLAAERSKTATAG